MAFEEWTQVSIEDLQCAQTTDRFVLGVVIEHLVETGLIDAGALADDIAETVRHADAEDLDQDHIARLLNALRTRAGLAGD